MSVKTEEAARRGGPAAARAPGRGPARATPGEHLSRAEREARGKAAEQRLRSNHTPTSARIGRGIRSGCCWSKRRPGYPSWFRSGTAACWHPRSPSTAAPRCRWPSILPHAASGLRVQLCGDAHLSNFGAFASPARRLVFDVNDFDETLPGPFEWDVKRLAASFAIAGREKGFRPRRGARSTSRVASATAWRCESSPTAVDECLVRPPRRRGRPPQFKSAHQNEAGQGHREDAGEGPHPRQHAGVGASSRPWSMGSGGS